MALQVSWLTALVGATRYFGLARVLAPFTTFSDTTVDAESAVGRELTVAFQAVEALSTLLNTVVAPLVSLSVNDPVGCPVRVRLSKPISGFQPPAEVAVKPVAAPWASTTETEVGEVCCR